MLNKITSNASVELRDPKSQKTEYLNTILHSVYNGDFKHGGRFYTSTRYGYQQLMREERQYIFINNEPTVELDYSGLHPTLLYAWEKIQYDEDPYRAIIRNDDMRSFLKAFFLTLINAPNEKIAISAGNKYLYDNPNSYKIMKDLNLNIKGNIIPMIKHEHEHISKYFCKNIGLKCMYVDSQIALDIMENFIKDKIPILVIHDSFIVQQKYKEKLRTEMERAYFNQTDGFNCSIK